MNFLEDTIFLAANTIRSRAYAQAMKSYAIFPSKILLLPGEFNTNIEHDSLCVEFDDLPSFDFVPQESIQETFLDEDIKLICLKNSDINSGENINLLKKFSEKVIIYSGFGGVILRKPILSIGKSFLHIHGGYAPEYKGSTAFYYSILDCNLIGATALWLNEEIDSGPIIKRVSTSPIDSLNVDLIQDPSLRAILLREVLMDRVQNGDYDLGEIHTGTSKTYYVIHPLLKHLALKRINIV